MRFTRRSRLLGTIATAVLALSASFASIASAEKFEADSYPVELKGEAVNENPVFLVDEGKIAVECLEASVSGSLSEAKEVIEVLPDYDECEVLTYGIPATVSMEGCKYRVNASTYDMDLVCPEGKKVKVAAATCTIHIGSQNDREQIEYLDSEGSPQTFTAEADVEKLTYTATDGFLCPLSSGGEKQDGVYHGDFLVGAFSGEAQVGVRAAAGVWMRSYPKSFNFGQVAEKTLATKTIFFRYVGGGNVWLLSASISHIEGELGDEPFSLGAETCKGKKTHGQYCSVVVKFEPKSKGKPREAEVAIDQDPEQHETAKHFEMIVKGEGK